ncbi:tyrosine-type recombinase/integrase [Natrinema sp. 1APR25-10V2]|uniref:tyrosine-type recombinase/integrase n=1 Tax=Natrinema sp. 1APR25-10V2 TaxID=2951081 RepID=UPI002874DC5E|nr:tyrosine-type recombinase/integrase [Natrinema sp. 1APR25-10V2]MDS0474373.1 tyrosine-type recombinase/integrase [Natrinema sp. 1APR25-10V2]
MADRPLDVHRYGEKAQRALNHAKQLNQPDKKEVTLYGQAVIDDLSASSAYNRIGRLKRLSQVLEKPLTDCDEDDIRLAMSDLAAKNLGEGRSYKPGTKRKYLETVADFGDRRNVEALTDIDVPSDTPTPVNEDIVLSKSEVWDLLENANKTRTKALIAVSWECAWRASALLSLKIKDYHPQGSDYALLTAPTNAVGLKDADGNKKPLTVAKGYLENWLSEHPCRDDPDAALFCRTDQEQHYGSHLSNEAVRKQLNKAAENAEIDTDRVNVHAFRHARATFMKKSDEYSDLHIETTLDWADGTNQHARYEHLDQDDKVHSLLRARGVEPEDDPMEPEEQDCPQCQRAIPYDARSCPYCSLIVDDTPAGWYQHYCKITVEDDPVRQKYDSLASATPTFHQISKNEFEHARAVGYWAIMAHDHDTADVPDRVDESLDYDAINAMDREETSELNEQFLLANEDLAKNYVENPTDYKIAEDDLERLEELADRYSDDDE